MLSEAARRRGASNGNSSRCEAKCKDVEVLSSWQQMEQSAAHMIGPSLDIDFHTSGSRQASSTSQHRHRTLSGICQPNPLSDPHNALDGSGLSNPAARKNRKRRIIRMTLSSRMMRKKVMKLPSQQKLTYICCAYTQQCFSDWRAPPSRASPARSQT